MLVAEKHGLEEDLQKAIQDASFEYLAIRVNIQPMGLAPSFKQLAELYEKFKGIESTTLDSHTSRKETGSGMKLFLNPAKVNELEVQLMSAILIGQEDSLQQLLDRVLAELSHQAPEEMKIQALTLSIALLGTIQKQFDPEGKETLARIPYDMPQSHWTSEEVTQWADKQVKNFLLLFSSWQASKSDNLIERAIKYIEEHYNNRCSGAYSP